MKVGVFTETYAPQVNGVVTSIRNLNTFLKSGDGVPVVFTTGESESVDEEEGTPVHRFKSIPFKPYPEYLVAMPHMRKSVKFAQTYELDLIHTHGAFSMGACALYVKKTMGLPLVGTFHTMLPEYMHYLVGEREVAKRVLKRPSWSFLRWYFNQCDVVVAPSKATARELKSHEFKKVKVVPNSVDTRHFRPVKSSFAEDHGTKKDYALFLGRVTLEKNVETVLEAAALLSKVQFVIAGEGPHLDVLKTKSPPNVFFAGFVSDDLLPSLYSGAKAFLMPSVTDTQGLTILESMACGTPVVCVPERGPKELVENGKNGFFARTPEEFASSFSAISHKMSKSARKTAEKFSIEKCGEKMLKIYRKVSK